MWWKAPWIEWKDPKVVQLMAARTKAELALRLFRLVQQLNN